MGKKKVIAKSQEEVLKEKDSMEAALAKQKAKAAGKRTVEEGRVYISASYNNTLMTVTDKNGKVLAWVTAGSLGFYGPKKATPFAASKVAEAVAEKLRRTGPFNVEVILKGVGSGRDSAIRTLAGQGFNILSIQDVTPIPHNGPTPRKPRRV